MLTLPHWWTRNLSSRVDSDVDGAPALSIDSRRLSQDSRRCLLLDRDELCHPTRQAFVDGQATCE